MLRWILLLILLWILFELSTRLLIGIVRTLGGSRSGGRVGSRGRAHQSSTGTSSRSSRASAGQETKARELVQCAQCGVHFPRPPGPFREHPHFCSDDCRQRAAATGS
ncbi:MAG: hypothetical protein SX243_09075 [Acidobacteriota bacterium]|nr:hypothetical protein [Acidobacteriota bacterium]